jgi:hypothetical protein
MNPVARVRVPSAAPIDNVDLAKQASINEDRQAEHRRLRVEHTRQTSERARENRRFENTDSRLGLLIDTVAREAFSHKCTNGVMHDQTEALRYYKGEYTAEEKRDMPDEGETALWYPLTEMMVKRMYAFLTDTLSSETGNPTFDMRPTAIPDVPPLLLERAQEALLSELLLLISTGVTVTETQIQDAVELMTDKLFDEAKAESEYAVRRCKREVQDRLDATNYFKEYFKTLFDVVLYGTGVLYGPFPTVQRKATFNSASQPVFDYRKNLAWKALDLTHFAPSPCSTETQDGRYCVYMDKMSKAELNRAKSCDWHAENIDYVLERYPNGYSHCRNGQFGQIDQLRDSAFNRDDKQYDMIWYWGEVDGDFLLENNVTKYGRQDVDPNMCYEMEICTVGSIPVRVQQPLDPECKRPLHKTVMYDCPGAFHGRGTWHRLRDIQKVINASYTSIPYDLGFTAFPIVEYDKGLQDTSDGDDEYVDVSPGSLHMKNSSETASAGQMINIHQTQSHVNLFSALVREQIEHAETLLGLPRYLAGGAVGSGATRTASGLAQLQSNAFTNLKCIIRNVDIGLTKEAIGMLHRMIMASSDNPQLFGDVEVVVIGHTTQLARQIHRDSLQQDLGTLFPFIQAGVIPVEGALEILRDFVAQGGRDARRIIPDQQFEEARQRELQAVLGQMSNISGGVASSAAAGGALGGQQLTGGVGAAPPQGQPQQAVGFG